MPKALTPKRLGAGLALIVAIAVVLILVLGNNPSSAGSTSNSAVDSAGATTVQRRDLVETDTESGTLSYANPQTVYNNLSGTITWLPKIGQLIRPGQTLYKIDGVPVMLMNGSTPAYRDLSAADTPGEDILELNRSLISLGFNPDGIVADDTWQAATTDGVDVLQAYLGQTETGILSLGQVVFLPGPQLVSTLDENLGADPGGPTSASTLASTTPGSGTEFVSLSTGTTTTPTTTTPTTTTQTTTTPGSSPGRTPTGGRPHEVHRPGRHKRHKLGSLQALIALLKAEIAELKAQKSSSPGGGHAGSGGGGGGGGSSGGGGSGGGSGGGGGGGGSSGGGSSGGGSGGGGGTGGGSGGGTAVLETTSTELVATVDLDPSKQSEAKVGEKVTVEMPAGTNVDGRITAVSSVAQSSSSGSGDSGGGGGGSGGGDSGSGSSSAIPVTIALHGRQKAAGLDQAAVSVNFNQAEAKHVLSVPVTALLAVPGGGYALEEAASPHKLVPVRTGLFAAGYVQISGSGVHEGLQVTNSEG